MSGCVGVVSMVEAPRLVISRALVCSVVLEEVIALLRANLHVIASRFLVRDLRGIGWPKLEKGFSVVKGPSISVAVFGIAGKLGRVN